MKRDSLLEKSQMNNLKALNAGKIPKPQTLDQSSCYAGVGRLPPDRDVEGVMIGDGHLSKAPPLHSESPTTDCMPAMPFSVSVITLICMILTVD